MPCICAAALPFWARPLRRRQAPGQHCLLGKGSSIMCKMQHVRNPLIDALKFCLWMWMDSFLVLAVHLLCEVLQKHPKYCCHAAQQNAESLRDYQGLLIVLGSTRGVIVEALRCIGGTSCVACRCSAHDSSCSVGHVARESGSLEQRCNEAKLVIVSSPRRCIDPQDCVSTHCASASLQ